MSDLDAGGPSAGGRAPDDFADQYNDFSVDDPFAMPLPEALPTGSRKRPSGSNAISSLGLGIGLDEEVIIAKKPRLIAPKFDESLLLDTTRGIPKLQERAKKLRLKGKGHEFSDVGRMLEMYQIWLNNLYPKNKFLDAAATVERLGHKGRVVVARKGWIDAGKYPKEGRKDVERVGDWEGDIFADPTLPPREPGGLMQQDVATFRGTSDSAERQKAAAGGTEQSDAPDDLDLDDLFDTQDQPGPFRTRAPLAAPTAQKSMFGGNDVPSDDDLDALMAEQEMNSAPAPEKSVNRFDKWRENTKSAARQRVFKEHAPTEPDIAYEDSMLDEDDLDALMAEAEMTSQPSKAGPKSIFGPQSSQPGQETQDEETDDLDALLAESVESTSAKQRDAKIVREEEVVDYDAMFEETEKLHDTLDKVVEKAKEKENWGVDEDEMAAMDDMGW